MPWNYLFDFISLLSLLQIAAAVWNEKQKKKVWNSQNCKGTSIVFCNSSKAAAADDALYFIKKRKENNESNEEK